jgi:phytoene dehydrogenase-like protein
MRSYRRDGLDCPVGVHYVGALGDNEPMGRMFDALGIKTNDLFTRMGSEGVIDRYIFDDFSFELPTDIEVYEDNLRRAFGAESEQINTFMKNLREIHRRMLNPAFLINQGDPFQNIDYLQPLGEYLDKLAVSPRLRAVIAVPCELFGVPSSDCPVLLHHMVLAGYLFSAWRLRENGARMTDVLLQRFQNLGGEIILNDGAEKILISEGLVQGVRLASGREISADHIVADIHPKILLGLMDNNTLRPALTQRILDLKETNGVICAQISVDAAAHPETAHNTYRLHADEKGEIRDGVFYQIRKGNAQANLLSVITRSFFEEWSAWEDTLSGRRPENYTEKKSALAQELLQKAQNIFGPLKNARVIDVFTPLTIRDYVNCPRGSCYGVMRSAQQLLKIASLNNPPIGGLYFTGQNALAPGVLGSILGSFEATRKIIGTEEFNHKFRWRA